MAFAHSRKTVVLFGDSITEQSFSPQVFHNNKVTFIIADIRPGWMGMCIV